MAFTLPVFNLSVNVWHGGLIPPAPPSRVTVGNLSPGRLVSTEAFDDGLGGSAGWLTLALLRLPPGDDVRSTWQSRFGDLVEVPAGSSRFYRCHQVEDIGKGFANEHRLAYLMPTFWSSTTPWSAPYP